MREIFSRNVVISICAILGSLCLAAGTVWFLNADAFWNYPMELDVFVVVEDVVFYDELESTPDYVEEPYYWFNDALPRITMRKLKKYMKNNDLCILPGDYSFKNTDRMDALIECFKFGKASEHH